MEIQHFFHEKHLMLLRHGKTTDDQKNICGICARSDIEAPFYACDLCGYYLHKSCAELPRLLNHFFHPSHPLKLYTRNYKNYHCHSCHRPLSNPPYFYCAECNFKMHVECAMMPPISYTEVEQKEIIQHFSHQHLLPLVEIDNKDEIDCWGCQSTICSGDRAYGCTNCEYFLHESCAKLPREIQHPYHRCHGLLALQIMHFQFQCKLCTKSYEIAFTFKCEKCRLQLCVKCSAMRGTIKYIAHVHCVTSEIIKALTRDLRDVELKTLGEDIWKSAQDAAKLEEEQDNSLLTLKDVINALTVTELDLLMAFYKWDNASSKNKGRLEKSPQSKLRDEDVNRILELSCFTNVEFKKFFDELRAYFNHNQRRLELNSSDLRLKIKLVKGYKVPFTLAPVLKTLLGNCGDVSSWSESTKEWKSIVYYILCLVLKRMSITKVGDITRNLLQEWYFHLRFVEFCKFKIGFALAHLERLVRAFLGLEAKRLEDEIPTMLNRKMAKLQQEMEDVKSKLKKCEEYNEGSCAKSDFMNKCLNEASELRWNNAYEGLFTDPQGASPDYDLWESGMNIS
ncbi:Zinc finger, RING/FYVE/PHD-type [Trema orientale]|uniref:Zinc finger, RING/FYVE/PHD-type n=1 Tax=Trema orientale TaxID=63057 RepID=A0A2P5CGY1_TREOI|nr:Zinc finger, RING/FYVE/PHD-type [Trema orientale]